MLLVQPLTARDFLIKIEVKLQKRKRLGESTKKLDAQAARLKDETFLLHCRQMMSGLPKRLNKKEL